MDLKDFALSSRTLMSQPELEDTTDIGFSLRVVRPSGAKTFARRQCPMDILQYDTLI
jgi:hypothetical protein